MNEKEALAILLLKPDEEISNEKKEQLKGIITRTHLGYYEVLLTYCIESNAISKKGFALYANGNRERELKDIAKSIAKKYGWDTVIFVNSSGKAVVLCKSLDNTEKVLDKYSLTRLSEIYEARFDSFSGRVMYKKWQSYYKKYKENALEKWDEDLM